MAFHAFICQKIFSFQILRWQLFHWQLILADMSLYAQPKACNT